MKPQNQQIVSRLEELTDDLFYSLVGDEPYVNFAWEVEEKGEFSLENFLLDNQGLTPFDLEDFLRQIRLTQSQQVSEHYQNLISLLQANLSELKIYSYGFPELPGDLFNGNLPINDYQRQAPEFPVFIGSTSEGAWIGLAPEQKNRTDSSPEFIISELTSVSESTMALVEQIKSVTSQIDHQSQYWKLSNLWQVVITSTRNEVIEKLLDEAQCIDVHEMNRFLRCDLKDEDELEDEYTQREFELRDFFQSQFINPKVYNLDFNISREHFTIHYLLGQTKDGDCIGLVTDSFTF